MRFLPLSFPLLPRVFAQSKRVSESGGRKEGGIRQKEKEAAQNGNKNNRADKAEPMMSFNDSTTRLFGNYSSAGLRGCGYGFVPVHHHVTGCG